ncbi:MAG: hypothetical protein AAFQ58_00405 [Pseudomonadota bacterium]
MRSDVPFELGRIEYDKRISDLRWILRSEDIPGRDKLLQVPIGWIGLLGEAVEFVVGYNRFVNGVELTQVRESMGYLDIRLREGALYLI